MNVLIVDDHALIREGIGRMVKALQPDAEIRLASSYGSGMDAISRERIDFVFLDIQLPDQSGFVAIKEFRELNNMMSIVVVSALEDRGTVMRALELGAKAFVPKSADVEKMRGAFETLLDGRVYLPESVLGADLPGPQGSAGRGGTAEKLSLTERQKDVLSLLIMGLSNKMIARRLSIMESTVKIHVSAILKELKVTSRTQALIAAARHGIKLPLQ